MSRSYIIAGTYIISGAVNPTSARAKDKFPRVPHGFHYDLEGWKSRGSLAADNYG